MTSYKSKWVLTGSQLDFFATLTVVLRHVKALVNDARDGLDLCSKLLLDAFQVEAIIVSNQVDGQTQVSEAAWVLRKAIANDLLPFCLNYVPPKKTRALEKTLHTRQTPQQIQTLTGSANAMKVRFTELGEVKIDHDIHSLNVNSSCEEVWVKRNISKS